MTFRIGEGWDTHALVAGRKLILGGVEIPHSAGLLGHSDADALLHAITDALLGAAALGDIGRHFPDTDAQFRGADSALLLAEAARRVRAEGWEIGNVDSTVIAQAPRLAPHIPAMRARIAQALGVGIEPGQRQGQDRGEDGPGRRRPRDRSKGDRLAVSLAPALGPAAARRYLYSAFSTRRSTVETSEIQPTRFGSGQAVRRLEDESLLVGAGRYTDDVSLPGQTWLSLSALALPACANRLDRHARRPQPCRACCASSRVPSWPRPASSRSRAPPASSAPTAAPAPRRRAARWRTRARASSARRWRRWWRNRCSRPATPPRP